MARPKSDSAQIAFTYIRDQINKYDLFPGDTVSDVGISAILNMSRTPVKEAIMQLVQYNLVERQKTRFVVKSITVEDIREIFVVREAIETMSVKLIIQNGGLSKKQRLELENIETKLANCLALKDYYNNFKYDSLFHKGIVAFINNFRFISIMDNMTIQGERLRWLSILTPNRYQNAIEEHRKILSAIESGDVVETSSHVHEHLVESTKNYETITKGNNWEEMIISFKKAFN